MSRQASNRGEKRIDVSSFKVIVNKILLDKEKENQRIYRLSMLIFRDLVQEKIE